MYIVPGHGRHRCTGGILPPSSRGRWSPLSLIPLLIIIAIATPRGRPHVPLLLQRYQSVLSEIGCHAKWGIMLLGVDEPHNQRCIWRSLLEENGMEHLLKNEIHHIIRISICLWASIVGLVGMIEKVD